MPKSFFPLTRSTRWYLLLAVGVLLALTAKVWLPEVSVLGASEEEKKRSVAKARELALRAKKLRRPELLGENSPAKERPSSPASEARASEVSALSSVLSPSESEEVRRGEDEEQRYDKPREALAFFRKKRLNEGEKEVPVEKYFAAQEQMQRMEHFSSAWGRKLSAKESQTRSLVKEEAAAAAATWTPLGPGNIGGRTRSILIHPQTPNVMFAAGVSGGVWKSTDSGQSWVPITDALANLTVSSMVMEPGNPNVIYVGTGEGVSTFGQDTNGDFRGAGIFKTTDGGATWARLQSTVNNEDFFFVNDLVISPTSKDRLYAGTRSGVWRSTDGGGSWTRVLQPTNFDGDIVNGGCLDLLIRPDQQTDVVFAACGTFEQATVYRTADGAGSSSWGAVLTESGMGRTSLAIAPSNPDTIYAVSASVDYNGNFPDALHAVFRSTTGGVAGSWTPQVRNSTTDSLSRVILSIPILGVASKCGLSTGDDFFGQAWYDLVIAVDPLDPNRVWVGGIEIFRSDNGGVNWGLAGPVYVGDRFGLGPIHPDQHAIVFHPQYNGTSNQTMFVGNDGGLYRAENARGPVLTNVSAVCTAKTSGINWTKLNNGYGVTQFYHGVVSPDGKTYFGGTQDNGTVLGTDTNGLNSWKEINGGDGSYTAIDPANPNILYSANTDISIQKSTDGGATFSFAVGGINDGGYFITPFAMDPSDAQRLWTGGDYIWRTTAGGARWTRASAITAGFEKVSALGIAPTDANRMLVGMGDGYILRQTSALTSGSGDSWPNLRPRRGYVSSLTFDPRNKDIAYATYSTFSGGAHVWRSTDGGATWNALDGSGAGALPDVPVHSLVVDPTNSARLFIGTDVGVFVSTDTGANWMVESTGFPNVITESLQAHIAADGTVSIYAFTHGRGAWRAVLNTDGCLYSLSPTTTNVDSATSRGTLNVKAAPGRCAWTATSNASWLTVTGSGNGDGTVSYEAAANNTFADRTATATIAGRTFTVTQPGRADGEAPVVAITDPSGNIPVNTTGLITLSGTATDNNAVTAVVWESDRGATGTATLTASTGRWTIAAPGIPLAPGMNLITIIARDAGGNVGRTAVTVNATPGAVVVTVVGSGARAAAGDGGPAAAAQISRPYQIDFDGAGNLYVVDTDNHAVRKVAPNGVITTIAGRAGQRGFSGDGGPATSALLDTPVGVAADGAGNVYITDIANNRIRKVAASTGIISTFAGNGREGFSGDGGPATDAQINFPFALDTDSAGNLYIADYSNHRIRKVTIADGRISTVAGNGNEGFGGDGGPATSASLAFPLAVTLDNNGDLIVCDSGNNRIRKVTISSGSIQTIVGTGITAFSGDGGPATSANINTPNGAIVDPQGNLFFCDRGNRRIRRVAVGTNIITTIAGSGTLGFNGDGLAALASHFNFPNSLAFDPAGNLYIADRENGRVRRLVFAAATDNTPPAIALTAPATGGTVTITDDALNVSGTASDNLNLFQVRWSNDRGGSGVAQGTTNWRVPNLPLQIGPNRLTFTAWDANGNAASTTLTVNFNPTRIITTYAGTGVSGDSGDGGAAVAARLSLPAGIALDAAGNLYVADSANHRVRKITPGGAILPFAGTGNLGSSGDGGQAASATLNDPQSVAVDGSGNVFITDTGNSRIRRVAPNGVITTYAGDGFDGFEGDGGLATQARLSQPYGIAVDQAGNLYISDAGNRRVRKVTASDGKISTLAGTGRLDGTLGDGGQAVNAQLQFPFGVAVDRAGVVYVMDALDNRVRRISPAGVISTYVGDGEPGFSGDGGPATNARINFPSYMTTDADGNLYFADQFNYRIRKVDVRTNIISTVAGVGTAGATGDGATPVNAQLTLPNDVAFDAQGNMYIADYGNQKIRKVVPVNSLRTVASVSAASFLPDVLASEAMAAAFGPSLATSVQVANSLPLPLSLGGSTVRVRDAAGVERLAPLFFVSSGQINFQVPVGSANGAATVTVTSGEGVVSSGVVTLANVAPGLFSANADGQGIAAAVALRVRADGAQIYEPVSRLDTATNRQVAVPIDLGPETDQVFLIAFGTGLRFRTALSAASATVGGANAELLFVGSQGGFVGLDQANIRLSRSLLGRGDVDVRVTADGKNSNIVRINIK